jgi:lipopolysaccharide/colanic/teichoic acid biosynthesis glycosyltransferase
MTTKSKTVSAVPLFLPGRRLLAVACILFFLPVLIAVGFLVRCGSPGPILVTRMGRAANGAVIAIWSFRCETGMAGNRLDVFLSTTRLEALPGLLNVLRGELRFDALFD